MPIPHTVKIKNRTLPNSPGVYIMKAQNGTVIYIGKAGSVRNRVRSYFLRAHDAKTERLVHTIANIDYITTESILEATFKEAELIKKYQPKYNSELKDDKSFAYLVITKDDFPKLHIMRGREHENLPRIQYKAIFGPFMSAHIIFSALKMMRTLIPWSNCTQPKSLQKAKPCFYYQLGFCPGICLGKISKEDYAKNIRNIILLLKGKKRNLIKALTDEMKHESSTQNFEHAAQLRNQIFHLQHIDDAVLLQKESESQTFARIEGYDISNISGMYATGSMVVFVHGEPQKSEYKRFKIKTVNGSNDTAMIKEIITRRFLHAWAHPDVILIDGGTPQVNAAYNATRALHISIPIVGIAKGPQRKNTVCVFGPMNLSVKNQIQKNKKIFILVRNEAHRFAVAYHRLLRSPYKSALTKE